MKEPEIELREGPSVEEVNAKEIDTYSLCKVDDIQESYEYGKLYLVGSKGNFWLTVFHCPCGCGELLQLLLLDDATPHWTAELIDENHVDLSPSIWKIHGCKSHFFVKNNRVIWASEPNGNPIKEEDNMGTCENRSKAIIDIVFCVDCTNAGAVAVCVGQQIIRFIESLDSKVGTVVADWRARVVGYGDLEIGETVQNSNEFVCDVASFKSQYSYLEKYAGGDEPESTLDAICYAATQSDWRDNCKKFVFVLTDATTHDIHSSTRNTCDICNVDDLKWLLVEKDIRLFLWGPNDPYYSSFKGVPKSEIVILKDANGRLFNGEIDLTEYLDEVLLKHD